MALKLALTLSYYGALTSSNSPSYQPFPTQGVAVSGSRFTGSHLLREPIENQGQNLKIAREIQGAPSDAPHRARATNSSSWPLVLSVGCICGL